MADNHVPPGWYSDPDDNGISERYWTGFDWTEQTRPSTRRPAPSPASTATGGGAQQQYGQPAAEGASRAWQTSQQPGQGQQGWGQQQAYGPQGWNQEGRGPTDFQQGPAQQGWGQQQSFGSPEQGREQQGHQNGFGVTALVLGIIGTLFGFIPLTFFLSLPLGVLAVIFGALGLRRVARHLASNKGVSIAGLVLGLIAVVLGIIGAVIVNNAANDVKDALNGPDVTASAPADGSGGAGQDQPITNLPLGRSVTSSDSGNTTQISALSQKRSGGTLGVLVTYDCTSGSCSYNPFDWKLRSADGTEYDYSPSIDQAFEPTLSSGDLAEGTKARGYVEFEAPRGSYTLEYSGSIFTSTKPTWKLP